MEQVAHTLQIEAIARHDNLHDFDQFGRSAFNRYYYALYLIVRDLLANLDSDWERSRHAAIPELLRGKVRRGLDKRRQRVLKLPDRQAVEITNQAIAAVRELSSTMLRGYSVRVTADYDPKIIITRAGANRFRLGVTDINEAHEWPRRAKHLAPIVLRAWKLPE